MRAGVQLYRSILAVLGILTLGMGGAEATQPQTISPPPSKESQASSPPMVSVVRLTNGNVLQGKVLRKDGGKVVMELPDVGQMTFAVSEIASIEDVSADAVSKLVAQTDEATEGLVYVNGQWTTPRATQQLRSQPHYPQQVSQHHNYHYYQATEEGLAEAQQALNRATKPEEVQQLKETIQRLRTDLTKQEESQGKQERKQEEAMAKRQQKYVEQQSEAQAGESEEPESAIEKANNATMKNAERAFKTNSPKAGKAVRFGIRQPILDPTTGQVVGYQTY